MNASSPNTRPVILCVEDEEDLRRDICDELAEASYTVVAAADGGEALDWLRTNRPNLILCDISMPGLNGYAVLNQVQAMGPDHAGIPFVFLSALGDPREIVEGKRLGADDYLIKPIDYDLLLVTVKARLRQIERIRSSNIGGAPSRPSTPLGLTPAETRVAVMLTQGRTLAQISTEFGISRTTVAFHLRNIFQKTGTRRQAELVAVLLKTQTPLATLTN